jgi:translation initiation factor 4E
MAATDTSYPAPADSGTYEAGLTTVGEFETVESYCRYFNWLKPPSKLERNSNYHLFKSGIKPMWEDEANANGGKWVLTMKNNPALLDQCWQWLTMALVGEELDESDEICGAVVSLRSKVDRIQLWMRSKDDVEKVNGIGRKLVKLLDVSEADGIGLDFQVSFFELTSEINKYHICVCPRPFLIPDFSTIRRTARSPTSSSRYRPSLSLRSGPRFTTREGARSLAQARPLRLPAPALARHSRALGSAAACWGVVEPGARSAGAEVPGRLSPRV